MSRVGSQADGEALWGLDGEAGWGLGHSTDVKGRMTEEAATWAVERADGEAHWGLRGLTPVVGRMIQWAATCAAKRVVLPKEGACCSGHLGMGERGL